MMIFRDGINRREFLGQSATGLAMLGLGATCLEGKGKRVSKTVSQTAVAEIGNIRSILLHLGSNMWCDFPTSLMGSLTGGGTQYLSRKPETRIVWEDKEWREITDHIAKAGMNMLVIDIGEGLYFPSHPELAIEGTWSVEKMQAEIKRLNQLGLEVVPKLNFSTTHNSWMGDYSHMVSSKPYYRMCEDVIGDVMEIFGHPRFFHIGFDEETAAFQDPRFGYVCVRKGEYWWTDFLHIVNTVEKHGARPWMWSDYAWASEDFIDRCPKNVVQQNWFYDEANGGFDLETNTTDDIRILRTFLALDKAGFDQVPCGTNWAGWARKQAGIGADDVMGKLVAFSREHISKEHLWGFMMATWEVYVWKHLKNRAEYLQKIHHGVDLLADACKAD